MLLRFVHLIIFVGLGTAAYGQNDTISEITIEGHDKLKQSFIEKFVQIATGLPLDSTIIEQDIKRLKRLPSVAHAEFQVILKEHNDVKVIYTIEESFTLIPSANIYTSTDNEFAYRIGLYEFNGFGRNISFGGFYQKDIYSSFALNFRAPFLFSRHLGVAVNYQNLTTLEPVFFNETTADYKYNNTSFEILGLYRLGFSHQFEFGSNFFIEDYSFKSGATDPDIPQNLRVHKLLYKFIYDYNNINNHYQYVNGFRSIFNFQYVTSRDDALPEFFIGWNDFLYYKRVGNKGNWASRLRLGMSTNNDSPFAPFSVDNNLNIRGVGNTIDRGTAAIVLNTEFRHTIYDKDWFVLQTNVFVDAGSWRNPGGDFGDFVEAQNLRIYPGLGLRFMHKRIFNAIFRIDYGYGITKNAARGLVFGIGQYF